MTFTPFVDNLRPRIGHEVFLAKWFRITQEDVDVFSKVTDDWDYMHNDPERAKSGPWGGTIAHGYFLVSLISRFLGEMGFPMLETENERMLNYGLDRVRFVEPVLVGDNVRARVVLSDIVERRPGVNLVKAQVTYETERLAKAHMVADVLLLVVHGDAVHEPR